jgi:hypothetical protein
MSSVYCSSLCLDTNSLAHMFSLFFFWTIIGSHLVSWQLRAFGWLTKPFLMDFHALLFSLLISTIYVGHIASLPEERRTWSRQVRPFSHGSGWLP